MHFHGDFFADPEGILTQAKGLGIGGFCNTVTPDGYLFMKEKWTADDTFRTGLGLHPWWVTDGRATEEAIEQFIQLAPKSPFIGEIGLDFAGPRDTPESKDFQVKTLKECLGAVADGALASFHAVRAVDVLLDIFEQTGFLKRCQAIIHWFSGSSQQLVRAREAGTYFSVGHYMLASKKGRAYAASIPEERLLLESDDPPQSEPGFSAEKWKDTLADTLTQIASLRKVNTEDLEGRLEATSKKLLAF